MGHDIQTYGTIDPREKSATVPAGGAGIKGLIKQSLREDGWRLAVDRGPNVTEGQLGETTRLQQFNTFNTRYRVMIGSRWVDVYLTGEDIYRYDISFVDNRNGSEVFTMSGRGGEQEVAELFSKTLREISN